MIVCLFLLVVLTILHGRQIADLQAKVAQLSPRNPSNVAFTLTVKSPDEAQKSIPLGLQALRVMGDK